MRKKKAKRKIEAIFNRLDSKDRLTIADWVVNESTLRNLFFRSPECFQPRIQGVPLTSSEPFEDLTKATDARRGVFQGEDLDVFAPEEVPVGVYGTDPDLCRSVPEPETETPVNELISNMDKVSDVYSLIRMGKKNEVLALFEDEYVRLQILKYAGLDTNVEGLDELVGPVGAYVRLEEKFNASVLLSSVGGVHDFIYNFNGNQSVEDDVIISALVGKIQDLILDTQPVPDDTIKAVANRLATKFGPVLVNFIVRFTHEVIWSVMPPDDQKFFFEKCADPERTDLLPRLWEALRLRLGLEYQVRPTFES